MKQIRNILIGIFAAATLLVGCSKEIPANESPASSGRFVSVTLPVQVAEASSALPSAVSESSSRGSAQPEGFSVKFTEPQADRTSTRAIPQEFDGVWVLVFDSSGNGILADSVGVLAPGADISLKSLPVGTGYTFYVLVNSHLNSTVLQQNLSYLSQLQVEMIYTLGVFGLEKLPMSGRLDNVTVIDLGDGTGQIKLSDNAPATVVMRRIHAQVTLTVDFDVADCTLIGARLYNIPVGATYAENDSLINSFPIGHISSFKWYDSQGSGERPSFVTTSGTHTTFDWFVPENRRGEIPGISHQIYRNVLHAPEYATYARILVETPLHLICYDVYLGSGALTNFDVRRNHIYTLTATIKGHWAFQESLIATDPRVSSMTPLAGISLTDNKSDSPILISPKTMESRQPLPWGQPLSGDYPYDLFNGKFNTDIIYRSNPAMQPSAARYCHELGSGEWVLPATNQLMLMWIYLPAIPVDERLSSDEYYSWYWTSTIENPNQMLFPACRNFVLGDALTKGLDELLLVRCVRGV